MTSPALVTWRSARLGRIDRLLAAHPHSIGSTTDPALAEQLTHALVLLLASEFQGFCRDLYDNGVRVLVGAAETRNSELRLTLADGLALGRGLNRRSADAKTLGDDFLRLGLNLWPDLAASHPGSAPAWREGLAQLHRARNGVAHHDLGRIEAVHAAGWAMQIGTIRSWRKVVDEITAAMDTILSMDIAKRVGQSTFEWEV